MHSQVKLGNEKRTFEGTFPSIIPNVFIFIGYSVLLAFKHSLFCSLKKDSQLGYVVVYVGFVSFQ